MYLRELVKHALELSANVIVNVHKGPLAIPLEARFWCDVRFFVPSFRQRTSM
jgi:hypothetical protein